MVIRILNPWKGLQGLPRGMWMLALSTFINRLGTMVMFFLSLYLVQARGWSAGEAATALGLYGAGALAASPFSGWFADRMGHRFTLAWSLGIEAGILLLIPYVHSRHPLLALITLLSAATQAYWPASMAVITDLVPPENRKQAFVLHRLATNLGIAVGPALGGFIVHRSFHALFCIDAFTTLAGIAIILTGIRMPAAPIPVGHPSASGWRNRRLVLLLVSMVPAFMAFTQIHGVLSLWVCRALGHDTRSFGFLFTLNTLLILFLEAAINHRLAHWAHQKQLALGASLIGLGFGSLYFFRSMPLLVLSSVIWTFGEMIFLPASSDAVAAMAPADRRGQYLGLYSLAYTAALALGGWLGLMIYGNAGPAWVWVACVVLGAVSAILMWLPPGKASPLLR